MNRVQRRHNTTPTQVDVKKKKASYTVEAPLYSRRGYVCVKKRYYFSSVWRLRDAIILIIVHRRNGGVSRELHLSGRQALLISTRGRIPFFVSVSKDNGPAVSLCDSQWSGRIAVDYWQTARPESNAKEDGKIWRKAEREGSLSITKTAATMATIRAMRERKRGMWVLFTDCRLKFLRIIRAKCSRFFVHHLRYSCIDAAGITVVLN